ncbi:MAG TPA: peptide deformylase [Vicinamibacteria bacterium]|nr:peptide deformylase [Vicinamibacteria bacterium]
MILKVARIGHPVVRMQARDLTREELRAPALQRFIDDMVETMHEYDGVGLAAPQVHIGLRLAVIEVPASDERSREGVPLTVLINPRLTVIDEETVDGWEGCLSVPDLRGVVPRRRRLRLGARDRDGKAFAVEAGGFFARVIQHECDHLDGRVYLDRMKDMRTLSFLPEFERYVQHPRAGDGGDDDEEEAG